MKETERHIAEMRAERDQAFELVEQMKEHVSDVDASIAGSRHLRCSSARMESERAMRCRRVSRKFSLMLSPYRSRRRGSARSEMFPVPRRNARAETARTGRKESVLFAV